MKRPVIFSGTTEGRQMSEKLSEAGVDHIICVATGYGELVMDSSPYAEIRQGRLDQESMQELIAEEASSVFDATHPYAAEVSENIRKACARTRIGYVRIVREDAETEAAEGITVFDDAASCAEALRDTKGNILLTTGSKDIAVYAADPEVRTRIFARVLPSEDSIRFCNAADISGRQVIAMQGPFSCEMNMAVIRQYDISVLVTKASGPAGGFPEKISAAHKCGIPVYVIGRPVAEKGIPVREAMDIFFDIKPVMHIDLIGTGPGRETLMTAEAREAVGQAEIIFGAERMIRPYADRKTFPHYLARDIIPVLEERRPERAAVLFSGDTGYCSGAAKTGAELAEWFEANGYAYDIKIHPGISSFAYLSAVTGEPYTDAGLCSMHGRTGDGQNEKDVIRTIMTHVRTFLLLSGDEDVRRLGSMLTENGLGDCMVVLGQQLSAPDERIELLTPPECAEMKENGLYTALILNESPASPAERPAGELLTPVMDDSVFIRGEVPMTKENIRHLSILRLGLSAGSVLYDIGSGTGSVACEAALQSSSLKVYAIEMEEEACSLVKQNADRFGLSNIEVVHGKAPEVFDGLRAPTHAFIGGSSGSLRDILEVLGTAPEGVRVVINAVSLETMAEIQAFISGHEISDLSIEQISVSRSRELGSYHLLTAENPVMIAAFTLGGRS